MNKKVIMKRVRSYVSVLLMNCVRRSALYGNRGDDRRRCYETGRACRWKLNHEESNAIDSRDFYAFLPRRRYVITVLHAGHCSKK